MTSVREVSLSFDLCQRGRSHIYPQSEGQFFICPSVREVSPSLSSVRKVSPTFILSHRGQYLICPQSERSVPHCLQSERSVPNLFSVRVPVLHMPSVREVSLSKSSVRKVSPTFILSHRGQYLIFFVLSQRGQSLNIFSQRCRSHIYPQSEGQFFICPQSERSVPH